MFPFTQGLIPDREVRVSVKSLALGCLAGVVAFRPEVFLCKVHKSAPTQGWCNMDVNDKASVGSVCCYSASRVTRTCATVHHVAG